WSQTETVRGARLHYSGCVRHHLAKFLHPPPYGAYLFALNLIGSVHFQVWSNRCLKKILDLSALNKHGRVYEDAQFGCLAWSTCENRLLYVAEGKRSIGESYASQGPRKDKSVYWEDWGEGLTSKSVPVLCVADVAKGTVTVLQGVPSHVSPGQGLWAHDGESVFFVGWWHEPFRLGLRFCSNRRSALFCLDLEGNCECLSGDTSSVSSPRLSPDGRYLVYLEGQVFGPHSQCLSMQQVSPQPDLQLPNSQTPFAGLYEALPPRCWASDSQRVVFSSARRNWRVTPLYWSFRLTPPPPPYTGHLGYSPLYWSFRLPPPPILVIYALSLQVVAFLPLAGGEGEVSWDHLGESCLLGAIVNVLDVSPTPQEENPEYSGLDFGALLVTSNHLPSRTKVPLVVFVHGGPHSQFFAEWNVTTAVLVKLGFAVLMVNYRGSTGFGQDSILSLAGNIGSQDVKDVQVPSELSKLLTLDPDKVVVMGGSHGGFLACHLIGQFPDFYKACAVRNPVINAATLLGTSDIVDCVGLQYSYDQLPTPEALTTMLQKSPITYAPQIKAPVLLMLGGKDRRVSPYQGLELYRSLKSRGSPVRLLWFAEDAHSLARVDTQADCFLNVVLWFQQHLYLH
uniref:acylaminoacyl-peptidase n=1 Tax=Salmo trutta TaxID=8032 RepID=A0A674C2U4_SALTR